MNADWWSATGSSHGAVPRHGDVRFPGQRVSDADRERVAAVVRDATVEGLLQFDEIDDRLGRVLSARTVVELDATVADMPLAWLAQRERCGRDSAAATGARESFRRHLHSYVTGMALTVGIWLILALVLGAWYFWPIWPALGWASVC